MSRDLQSIKRKRRDQFSIYGDFLNWRCFKCKIQDLMGEKLGYKKVMVQWFSLIYVLPPVFVMMLTKTLLPKKFKPQTTLITTKDGQDFMAMEISWKLPIEPYRICKVFWNVYYIAFFCLLWFIRDEQNRLSVLLWWSPFTKITNWPKVALKYWSGCKCKKCQNFAFSSDCHHL